LIGNQEAVATGGHLGPHRETRFYPALTSVSTTPLFLSLFCYFLNELRIDPARTVRVAAGDINGRPGLPDECDVEQLLLVGGRIVCSDEFGGSGDLVRHMSISMQKPNHGPQMWAIFRSPSPSKQSDTKYLIQSSWLPLRLVFDLAGHQICLFRMVSRTDQRSIVPYLHLKGLSAHAIHDGLVVTLGMQHGDTLAS
jgi:hypothetical protein